MALANGLAIGIMVTNLGHISGGHFNPSITLGFLSTRRISAPLACAYWFFQLLGATAAAFILRYLFTKAEVAFTAPAPHNITDGKAFVLFQHPVLGRAEGHGSKAKSRYFCPGRSKAHIFHFKASEKIAFEFMRGACERAARGGCA